jgi:hypothetical protein
MMELVNYNLQTKNVLRCVLKEFLEFYQKKNYRKKIIILANAYEFQVLLQRLSTRMNLIKRGLLAPPSTPCCVFCMLVEETESHLFSCCPVAVDVWTAINAWLGVSTAVPGNFVRTRGATWESSTR